MKIQLAPRLTYLLTTLMVVGWLGYSAASAADFKPGEFIKQWRVLGPIPVFDGTPRADDEAAQQNAFDTDFLSAHGGESGMQPGANFTLQIGQLELEWVAISADEDRINLKHDIYGETDFALAYASREIDVSDEMTVVLGVGSNDAVKVWLNGELVHEKWIHRSVEKDEDLVAVKLKQGKNHLLFKVQNITGGWGFACRIPDAHTLANRLVSGAGSGDRSTVEMLLSHGVAVNAKNQHNLTALQYATI